MPGPWSEPHSGLKPPGKVAQPQVDEGRPPSFPWPAHPKAPGNPKGTRPGPAGTLGFGGTTAKSAGSRVSQEGEGCRENPTPTESGAALPTGLPTTSCKHLPFRFVGCGFSRICFSERLGEYSRTIKYSSCGSCSTSMPVFIQQTFSEGLLSARHWRTHASVPAGKAGGRGGVRLGRSWARHGVTGAEMAGAPELQGQQEGHLTSQPERSGL